MRESSDGPPDESRRRFLKGGLASLSVAAIPASVVQLLSSKVEAQGREGQGFFERLDEAVTEIEWRLSERGSWGRLLSGAEPGLTVQKAKEIFDAVIDVQHGLYAADMFRTQLEQDRARFPVLSRLNPKSLPTNVQRRYTADPKLGKRGTWICNSSYIDRVSGGTSQLFEVTARHCVVGSTVAREFTTSPDGDDIAVRPVETQLGSGAHGAALYKGPPAFPLDPSRTDEGLQGKMVTFTGVNRHGKPESFYGFAIKVSPAVLNVLYPNARSDSQLVRNIRSGYVFFTKPGDGKILPDGSLPPQGLSGTMTWRWSYDSRSYIPAGPFFAAGADALKTSTHNVVSTGFLPGINSLQRTLAYAEQRMNR